MFFTHMPLNPTRRATRELVSSPQRLHAAILGGFLPDEADRDRVLWRLDAPERHRLDLYVLSAVEPSFEGVADQAGWPGRPTWRTASYRPLLDRLEGGQRWIFRLRANPVRHVRAEGQSRGKRFAIPRTPDQLAWLLRQGNKHGFRVPDGGAGTPNVRISEQRTDRFSRDDGERRRQVTLATVAFDGVLEVSDPGALQEALASGIGPAKGYGCGLLTLAPLP